MYGADAGSGVIIITTKSGKKGAAKFKLQSRGYNRCCQKRKKV
jgi:hypothetical protein